jgi:hypothetical protein
MTFFCAHMWRIRTGNNGHKCAVCPNCCSIVWDWEDQFSDLEYLFVF